MLEQHLHFNSEVKKSATNNANASQFFKMFFEYANTAEQNA